MGAPNLKSFQIIVWSSTPHADVVLIIFQMSCPRLNNCITFSKELLDKCEEEVPMKEMVLKLMTNTM
ncbi:hypothetical protein I3842_01G085000 [Carya illinoinensis]|uniref:Uncharacterized protein n=1 Tax=Carya illinoinensis TaxID=32201 RepID=A0A922G1A8_CARIL|nr:hypothetical protein I3842_01G085000 [Carya illinoinensis]